MKLPKDIPKVIEEDVKNLTKAIISGQILSAQNLITIDVPENDINQLSADILNYILSEQLLSPAIQYLSTMKWLRLEEACLYARLGRTTMRKLIKRGNIHGSKPEGTGDWIIDRQSIDNFYNQAYDDFRIKLAELQEDFRKRSS